MIPSHRTGSAESNKYFQSNRSSIESQFFDGSRATNRLVHDALQFCADDPMALIHLMNEHGKNYKLNLQNLATGHQPTIEFRQHSATMDFDEISAWIRFCISFCLNSSKFKTPTPFTESSTLDKKFECLFQFVIKDRALKKFYEEKRKIMNEKSMV